MLRELQRATNTLSRRQPWPFMPMALFERLGAAVRGYYGKTPVW